MMRFVLVLLLGLAATACGSDRLGPSQPVSRPPAPIPAATETGSHRVETINLELPAALGEFGFVSRRRFRARTEGDLLTYAFGPAYADIAIYDNARREIGTGPDSVAVKIEFEQSRQAFVATVWPSQRQAGPLQLLREGMFPAEGDEKQIKFLEAAYRGAVAGKEHDTRVLLTGFRDQFIRVRLTAPTDLATEKAAELDGFLKALAAILPL